MDTLRVDVVWPSEAAGDVREAAELLREIADRIEASIDAPPLAMPVRVMSKNGFAVLASARVVRDRR